MYLLNATHEKCNMSCNMLREISITIVAFFLIEMYGEMITSFANYKRESIKVVLPAIKFMIISCTLARN